MSFKNQALPQDFSQDIHKIQLMKLKQESSHEAYMKLWSKTEAMNLLSLASAFTIRIPVFYSHYHMPGVPHAYWLFNVYMQDLYGSRESKLITPMNNLKDLVWTPPTWSWISMKHSGPGTSNLFRRFDVAEAGLFATVTMSRLYSRWATFLISVVAAVILHWPANRTLNHHARRNKDLQTRTPT